MLKVLTSQIGGSLKSVRRLIGRTITVQAGPASPGSTVRNPPSQSQSPSPDDQRRRVRRMRDDLYRLMEQHPGSRQLMRHLDLVEKTLRRDGFVGVEALPVRVLAKALNQLEGLVWDWTAEGLAELRSRMAVSVKSRRPRIAPVVTAPPPVADTTPAEPHATLPHGPDVSEVNPSDLGMFAEMERSWAGQVPEAIARALAAAKEPGTR